MKLDTTGWTFSYSFAAYKSNFASKSRAANAEEEEAEAKETDD
jgi:hypothetical protein